MLEITVYRGQGQVHLEIKGRLDSSTVAKLDTELAELQSGDCLVQVLDLAGLNYISSAGVRSIFRARKLANQAGGQLVLVRLQPQVQKVFDIIKALPKTAIFTSVEELDHYLGSVQRKVRSEQTAT